MDYSDYLDIEIMASRKGILPSQLLSGEIADLTYAAGLRIAVLSTRVKALEGEGDDKK